jgi:hypothetical protein
MTTPESNAYPRGVDSVLAADHALSIYEVGRVEAGTTPDQQQDEVVFTAECSCGDWEEREMTTPIQDAERQARFAWLQHVKDAAKQLVKDAANQHTETGNQGTEAADNAESPRVHTPQAKTPPTES